MPIIDIINGLVTSGIIYSVILIGLAVFGFIIYDIFKMGQYSGIPNPYKSDIETFFHFVSLGLIGIAIFILILTLPLAAFSQKSLEMFLQIGIFDQDSLNSLVKILVVGAFLSFGYIILYIAIFYIGVLARFGNAIWVEVEFADHTIKQFNSFICDSENFYYFEDKEKFRLWEGRKKTEIIRISALQEEPRFDQWLRFLIITIWNAGKRFGTYIITKINNFRAKTSK